MQNVVYKGTIIKCILVSVIAAVISQLGSLYVSSGQSVLRAPTIKSLIFMILVALVFEVVIHAIYEVFIDYLTKLDILTSGLLIILFIGITVKYMLIPVSVADGIAYRYPSLAPVLAIEIIAELLFSKNSNISNDHKKFRLSVEIIFIVLSITVGLIMCFTLYPKTMTCWDDGTHFEQALYCSEGIYSVASQAEIKEIFMECPDTISELNTMDDEYYVLTNAEAFFPERISHITFAVGIWFGRLVGLSFSNVFKFGRASNLIFYSIIMYIAIKRLKTGKLVLAIVGLTPGILFLASNYSADAWVMGFICLAFAYYIGALQRKNEKLTKTEIIVIIGSVLIGSLPKPPYAFLLIAFVLMPKEKFINNKQRILFVTSLFACLAFAVAITLLQGAAIGGIEDKRAGDGVNGAEQIAYILSNPQKVIKMIFMQSVALINPINYYYLSSFSYLGGMPGYKLMVIAILLSSVILNNTKIHYGLKIWNTIVCFAMIMIIVVVFYVYYNPVGSSGVGGVQPRYMYPLIYPLYSILFCGILPLREK